MPMAHAHAACVIDAGAEQIWKAWTERESLRAWLFVDATPAALEPEATFCWTAALPTDRPMVFQGSVLEADPCRRLRLAWELDISATVSELTVELVSRGPEQTEVAIDHRGLSDSDLGRFETNGFQHYWPEHLDRLAAHLESRQPAHHHDEIVSGPHFVGGHEALGLLVRAVGLGSPAFQAGMRSGDILRSVDATPVRCIADYDDWLCQRSYGEVVTFGLARGACSVRLFPPPWTTGGPGEQAREGDPCGVTVPA
jgi:uncharacterized protein YndB with AHSA1/START domain